MQSCPATVPAQEGPVTSVPFLLSQDSEASLPNQQEREKETVSDLPA